jgi:hypothetical protein
MHDKQGKPIIKSWDYGLMQINSSNIDKGEVKDLHGHGFKIGEDVKTDWKANARAGVALLALAYRLAEIDKDREQLPRTTHNRPIRNTTQASRNCVIAI